MPSPPEITKEQAATACFHWRLCHECLKRRHHMKHILLHVCMLLTLGIVAGNGVAGPDAPKGSITIERIADVKYPTEQAWSPDGKHIAFLWDAAGKQDLYLAQPGSAPVALTDFPVDPDILTSNITHFEWSTNDEIIFGKDGNL